MPRRARRGILAKFLMNIVLPVLGAARLAGCAGRGSTQSHFTRKVARGNFDLIFVRTVNICTCALGVLCRGALDGMRGSGG